MIRLVQLAVLLGSVVVGAGCQKSGPVRVHVAGEITYKGKPLPAGIITIEPDITRGADGPQGFAQIKNGKFDTRQNGRMACQGPAIVSIQGYDGVSKGPENVLGSALFTQYTEMVELNGKDPTLKLDIVKVK